MRLFLAQYLPCEREPFQKIPNTLALHLIGQNFVISLNLQPSLHSFREWATMIALDKSGAIPLGREAPFQKYMILQRRGDPEINSVLFGSIKSWGEAER